MQEVYSRRRARGFTARLRRALQPPLPFVPNPHEPLDFPLGRWNLYVGGAGARPDGYVNLDLFALPGVDIAADAARLPFANAQFTRIECDAVLEHVDNTEHVIAELTRVLAPGGHLHIVVPFCHPFHQYPRDYRRFTLDGLHTLKPPSLELVAQGWRTGPTATLLVFFLEYVKLLFPGKLWRSLAHGILGWLLFPLRYLDLWLLRTPRAQTLGNHCYVWWRKRYPETSP
jgi:SAM-dependent methyltransferase